MQTKYLLVHIPKTAGTTALYLFGRAYGARNVLVDNYDRKQPFTLENHTHIGPLLADRHGDAKVQLRLYLRDLLQSNNLGREILKHLQRSRNLPPPSFDPTEYKVIAGHFNPSKYKDLMEDEEVRKVTVLRDPWERAISHFRWCVANPSSGINPRCFNKGIDPNDFFLSEEILNYQLNFLKPYTRSDFDLFIPTEGIHLLKEDLTTQAELSTDIEIPRLNPGSRLVKLPPYEHLEEEFREKSQDQEIYNQLRDCATNIEVL